MDGVTSSVARLLAIGTATLACSVQAVDDAAQAEGARTQALVTVARSAPAATPDEARADAFAGFLRTPGELDARSVFRVTGLAIELPALGECRKAPHGSTVTASPLTRIELLDAGEVTLAAGGNVTTLAPRAFPAVTDAISGVVYTTRDRTAAPLPPASSYTVATTGASALGPVSAEGSAPAALTGVALDSVPLAEVLRLRSNGDLKVSWNAGAPGDRVYLELDSEATSTVCAFRDDAGFGSVPAARLPAAGAASVSVHRLREADFGDVGLSRGQLRFDFELSASVSFE